MVDEMKGTMPEWVIGNLERAQRSLHRTMHMLEMIVGLIVPVRTNPDWRYSCPVLVASVAGPSNSTASSK